MIDDNTTFGHNNSEGIEYRLASDPVGNVSFREVYFKRRGAKFHTHVHYFPHALVVMDGEVEVILRKDAEERREIVGRKGRIEVPAGWDHTIVSRTDYAETWCTFAVRDEDFNVAYNPTEAQKKNLLHAESFVPQRMLIPDALKADS